MVPAPVPTDLPVSADLSVSADAAGETERIRLTGSWAAVTYHHVATLGATVAFAALVTAPLVLVALSAKLRHLVIAVAAGMSIWLIGAIFLVRATVPLVAYRRLGAHKGDEGLDALTAMCKLPEDKVRRVAERFERRWWVPCAIWPSAPVTAALAGHHRVGARGHALVAGVALAVRFAAVVVAGLVLRDPVLSLIDTIERYQWWAIGATVAGVLSWGVWHGWHADSGNDDAASDVD